MRRQKKAIWIWIGSILMSLVLPVYAEQLTVVRRMEYLVTPGPKKDQAKEYISYVMYQGHPAICIEPQQDMHFGNDYHKKSLEQVMGSNTNRLNHFMAYAFEKGVGQGDINYAAAQMYAWSLNGYYPTIQKGPHSHQKVQKRIQEIQKKVLSLENSEIELKDLTTGQVVTKVKGNKLLFTKAMVGHRYQVTRKLNGFQLKKAEGDIQGSIVHNQFEFTVDASFTKKNKKIALLSQSSRKKNFALIGKNIQNLMVYEGEEVEGFDLEIRAQGYHLEIQKEDIETKYPQGDVPNFDGTKYQLFNKEGKSLGIFLIQKGKSNRIENLLPNEIYYLKELVPPIGMRLHGEKIPIQVKSSELVNLKENTKTIVVRDQVKTGTFSIQKYLSTSEDSEFLPPEEKAEFMAILSKHVRKYGSFSEARKHVKEFHSKEYAILTTNETGYAKSSELAYGNYEIRQIKAGNKDIQIYPSPFFLTIQKDHQHQSYVLKNRNKKYYLRILKLDQDTKQKIQRSSATFRITRLENKKGQPVKEVISQIIASKKHSLFSTNSSGLIQSGWQDKNDMLGESTIPLALSAGKYEIEEVKAPKGYTKGFKQVIVLNQDTVEEKNSRMVVIPIENKRKKASFHLEKKWEKIKKETNFANRDFAKVQFELRAKESIYSDVDGTKVMEKGDLAKNIFGQEVGSFFLNKDGKADLWNLYQGSYELKEVKVPKGVELDRRSKAIQLSETPYFFHMKNFFTKTEFFKQDLNGKEIEGAKMILKEENGNEITRWTSKKEVHCIQGLEKGKTYRLEESVTPIGYAFAPSISFKIKEDGSITKVIMIDHLLDIHIQKVDELGNFVQGARLQLLDEKKEKILKEWISNGKKMNISPIVKADGNYWVREVKTPSGYRNQEDQLIHVPKYAQTVNVFFLNETKKIQLQLEKRERGQSKGLSGAHYRVFHQNGQALRDEFGQIVELVSDAQGKAKKAIPYSKEGYFLKEIKAPKGYEVDMNPIPILVEKGDSFDCNKPILLKVEDQKKQLVPTGDEWHTQWGILLFISFVCMMLVFKIRVRNEQEFLIQ